LTFQIRLSCTCLMNLFSRHKYGTTTDLFARPNSNVLKTSSSAHVLTTVGPSPFSGQPDVWAVARNNLSNRSSLSQQQQPQAGAPPSLGTAAPPAYGLPGAQTTGGLFGQPQQPFSSGSSFGGFNSTANASTGLLGNSLSPFGGGGANQSSIFSTGGKRGKH
jgi:hypothetical protein